MQRSTLQFDVLTPFLLVGSLAMAQPVSRTPILIDTDAAALGLAHLGRPDAAEPLFKAADSAQGWERTQATKACLVLAEKLAAAGQTSEAKRVYERLQKTRTADSEQHIRDAAQLGLAAIA